MATSSENQINSTPAPAPIAARDDVDALQKRVSQLEEELTKRQQTIDALQAQNERLLLRVSRSLFCEKDYENFDPSDYTIPVEEMLAHAKQSLKKL